MKVDQGTDDIRTLLFADDISMIALTPQDLQRLINILERVSSELGLSVNLEKTKIIIFRKGGYVAERERWFLAHKEVEIVNNYKYLGLILTTKLSMQTALTEFVSRAKKRVIDISKLIHSIGYMNPMIYFKLIDSIVVPLALYSSEVWGIREFSNINSITLYAYKRLLGVTKKTPNCLIYSELGRYPLSMYASLHAIKYWFKILSMEDDRLPKLAYNRELLENNQKNSWARGIQNIWESNGLGYVWYNQGAININACATWG